MNKDVVYVFNRLFSHKKGNSVIFFLQHQYLEGPMLSEVKSDQERHMLYGITYV